MARAGGARSALAAAFAGLVHNQDDGTDSADRALEVLRSLPVEQRMEAMGMIEAGEVNDAGDAWVSDHREWWPAGRYDGVPFYVEVPDA